MTTYKDIHGTAVQNVAGNPDNPQKGQLWYDSTNSEFKFQDQVVGDAWSTQNNLNTGRNNISGATAGTTSATIAFAGFAPPHVAGTESWNGTNWTEVNDLNTARNNGAGAGTSTSALLAAGYYGTAASNITESWNGTNWTEVGDTNTSRSGLGGTGASNTSALVFGGESSPNAAHNETESWNGTNWTEVNNLNTGRDGIYGGMGTATSALVAGGNSDPSPATELAVTENWNGTNWAYEADLNTARKGMAAAGTSTDSIVFGGREPSVTTKTESWGGSTWVEKNDMNIQQSLNAGSGTSASALSFGGYDGGSPGNTGDTELWQGGVSIGAWATGGSLNSGRRDGAATGTQTASLYFAGTSPGTSKHAQTESYNGTAFFEVNDLNLARDGTAASVAGAQTATICFAGDNGPERKVTELWNGNVWTELNDMNLERKVLMGSGISTSALGYGGISPSTVVDNTELWNGTNWTEVNDLNTATDLAGCAGADNTSALSFGGRAPPSFTTVGKVELWNGTNWTEVNDMTIVTHNNAGIGTATAALSAGSQQTPTNVQSWNGTNWSNETSISTGRALAKGAGTSTVGIVIGGESPFSGAGTTEEWNGTGFLTRTATTTSDN